MLWLPQKGQRLVQHNTGSVGVTSPGTSVTTGATSSTKGTPAELFSSTNFDTHWITIMASAYAALATQCQGAMDILIGSSTEEVLIANLLMGHCGLSSSTTATGPKIWHFPLYIPAGSRIACQAAGARTSTAFNVAMFLYGGDTSPAYRVGTKVTTYGMGTVPNGTSITPGVSGAEGSWTEITSSTTEDHFALVPSFQVTGDTTISHKHYALDIGVGAAAAEEQIAEGFWYRTDTQEHMCGPYNPMPHFQDIPSGTRLSIRVGNNGANDGGYDAVLHGVS